METELKKIGGSQFLIVPNSYIEVFNLDNYEYEVKVEDDGKAIIYKRVRKKKDKQTELDDFKELKGGLKK